MKLVFLSIALASSSVIAAAPPIVSQPASSAEVAVQQAPPSLERQMLARHYVALSLPPEKFVDGMRFTAGRMVLALKAASGDQSDDAEADKFVRHFLSLLEPKLRERVPNIMEAYSQAYAREFSADELQQMVAFAQSPTGQHYLAKQFDLASDPAVQLQEQGMEADVPAILHQIEKEQCAARTARRIAAGDTKAKCALSGKPDTQAG